MTGIACVCARVEQLLEKSAKNSPDKVALYFRNQAFTYKDLSLQSSNFSSRLRKLGLKRGDRVFVFLPNCHQAVVALFGVLKAGGVFSIINHGTKEKKLRYTRNDCRPVHIITNNALLQIALNAGFSEDQIFLTDPAKDVTNYHSFSEAIKQPANAAPNHEGINADLAMLVYTSGSTGSPKGVMITHGNICFTTTSINSYLHNGHDEVILLTLPVSFDYGLYQIFLAFQLGATVVLEQGFTFPAAILNACRKYQVTNFPLVPTIAALILQMKNLSTDGLDSLRCFTNTGAALPPNHILKLKEKFPSTKMYSMYGLTECKRCLYIKPEELEERPESVGKAIPHTEVFIVDESDHILPAGKTGELVVRGSHVMPGYWENDIATAKAIRPHPLHPWENVLYTGDLFRMDENGYFYFIARKDEIIKSRGEKVSPKEIENVLYSLSDILEAVVIGVPDDILGNLLKAIIVPANTRLTKRIVIEHCRNHLEPLMVPQEIEIRAQFEKTATGKIDRTRLT